MYKLDQQFSFFRSALWPIYRHEIKTILPMIIMLFLLSFNQCALWNLKDSLVITTAGAEVVPFIKLWAILPCSVLVTLIFTVLSNRFTQEKVFYLLISAFLLLYALFAFVLYPYRDQLHPAETAVYLQQMLPEGFKGMIAMYRYWTYTGFYVICELWNTIIISVLFWGFANKITRMSEASRFYSVLSIAFNAAIIVSGVASIMLARNGNFNPAIPFGNDAWEQTMMLLMLVIIVSGLLTMGCFRWMHVNVLNAHGCHEDIAPKRKKEKLCLKDSLLYVSKSPYLICLAGIVVGYNLVINLVEVVWKDQLRNLCPETLDYNHYISNLQIAQGAFAMILSLSLAMLIKRMGWTKTALVTPISMMMLCSLFFGILFFKDTFSFLTVVSFSPLAMVVFIGAFQNSFSKACKYSVFDSTKEMAFIPLSDESKLKGKTAIDGIGARFGKSGSSVIHQSLLILFASVSSSAPYVAVILLVVLIAWIIFVLNLGKEKNLL